MKTKALDNTKLGAFVLAGVLFMILTLYMIGKNRNLFGSTFTIKAVLTNVNGLVPGNNVRFKGIDVGTIKNINVMNDTSIYVTMTIDDNMKPYIKQNAIASIGTDGLMGNKLMNINSQSGDAPVVKEGSLIQSRKPVETDEMLRTLNTTNINMEKITNNLREITVKLNGSNGLWNLLADTAIRFNLKNAVKDFRMAGSNTADLTRSAKNIVGRFDKGEGIVETLFTDTALANKLSHSFVKIQQASDRTLQMIQNLDSVIAKMKEGQGTAGLVMTDTAFRKKLDQTALNVEQGTARFNENMEAMRSNFLFRGYFKDQEKEKAKEQKKKQSDAQKKQNQPK